MEDVKYKMDDGGNCDFFFILRLPLNRKFGMPPKKALALHLRSTPIRPNKFFGIAWLSQTTNFNRKIFSRQFCFFCCQKKKACPATTKSALHHPSYLISLSSSRQFIIP